MKRKHNPSLTPTARVLRKAMTSQEKRLWYDFLRDYPIRVLRQKVIDRFVVDFYCPKASLVIEVDGSHHNTKQGIAHDHERTQFLQGYGLTVLRFTNIAVDMDYANVCSTIDAMIRQKIPETKDRKASEPE